jgi:hypothetical protein
MRFSEQKTLKYDRSSADTESTLSVQTFMLVFSAASALIALWIAVRFPSFAPESIGGTFAVVLAAMVLSKISLPVVREASHLAGAFVGLFAVALPVAVFMFLAAAWTVLFAKKHLAPFQH